MEKKPAEPRLSATILMLRDAASGPPEVLMVKRHYEIDFAAGALVLLTCAVLRKSRDNET